MAIISTLQEFRDKVRQLKEAQARANGGRKTPIYINMDSFALNLGWDWDGTTRTVRNQSDMKEFFTHYVPILNDIDVIIYFYIGVSTFDKGIAATVANPTYLTLIANRSPSSTEHTFGGSNFTYDFRQIIQCNAELPWLDAMQMDECEAIIPRRNVDGAPVIPVSHPQYDSRLPTGHPNFSSYKEVYDGITYYYYSGLEYFKNAYKFKSVANRVWSRFMHEIARQKMAGYHADSNYNFSTAFKNAMSTYSYTSGDDLSSYNIIVNANNIATLQDLRQTIILYWRDCVRFLKGENVKGSDGVSVNITTGGNRAYGKVVHYANGVGPLTNPNMQPWTSLRGIRPTSDVTNELTAAEYDIAKRQRRILTDNRVYYNKSYFRNEETLSGGVYGLPNSGIWWRNNDAGLFNLSYVADQYGHPTATTRLFPTLPTLTYPNQGINIYGNPGSPKTNTIKSFIALQSNADSYATNLYFFHGCGQEWKNLIEAGIRTSGTIGKYLSTDQTGTPGTFIAAPPSNTIAGTIGIDTEINNPNDISVCTNFTVAGTKETYEDFLYWIASTSAAHVGHLRKQIIRNLEYNKAYLTGISDSNPTNQSIEIQKLAKKPICVILSTTPAPLAGMTVLARTHLFRCWPENVEEYVTPIISSFFQKGDKNTTLVDRPDEIMFWNAGNYFDITYLRSTYGNSIGFTSSTYATAALSNGIPLWDITTTRIGWEKLVLGREKLATTPYQAGQISEICAINYQTASVPLNSNESYFQSMKWCYDNMLPDDFWATNILVGTALISNTNAVWWSETGGTASAITSRGLQSLDQPTHKLYPYFKGTGYIGADGIDLYTTGSKTITQANVIQAIARYQSNWILRMLQETRRQLDAIGA